MMAAASFACAMLAASSAVALSGSVYNVPPDAIPATLVPGDVLNYDPQAILYDFLPPPPVGATVNLYSGAIDFASTVQGTVHLSGGALSTVNLTMGANVTISDGSYASTLVIQDSALEIVDGRIFELYATDSIVNFKGGTINLLEDLRGSQFNMTGGVVEFQLGSPLVNGEMNVSGGIVGDIQLSTGTFLNLSGGQIGVGPGQSFFIAHPGSTVHLYAQHAAIDGMPIPGLSPGATTTVDVTGLVGQLTGTLSDGSPFLFDLGPTAGTGSYPNDPIIITTPYPSMPAQRIEVLVTTVPEPCTGILAAAGLAALVLRASVRRCRG